MGDIKKGDAKVEEIERRRLPQWKKVLEGFLAGRAWAKQRAGIVEGTNMPVDGRLGRGYNEAFSRFLTNYGLDDIDQAARSNLFKLADNPAILPWHAGLPENKRNKLHHPTVIVRAWKAADKRASNSIESETDKEKGKRVTEEALTETVDRLRKGVVQHQIEAARRCDVDILRSELDDIERYAMAHIVPEHRGRRIRDIFLKAYPLPLPRVPVTDPDASTDDEIGL